MKTNTIESNIPKRARFRLMTHLVAGYPSDNDAFLIAQAMIQGGASILEIQLPFSDPSADGEAIQDACTRTLSRGYKVKDGLNLIQRIHDSYPEIPIFVMTYASICYTIGVENFVKKIKDSGASGVIIPDLPFDSDEGLNASCNKYNIANIPVVAPSIKPERLARIIDSNFTYIYAALRLGITGDDTKIDTKTIDFINAVSKGGAQILGGFGISNGKQAQDLSSHVSAIIAGSVFVRIISKYGNIHTICEQIKKKTMELTGEYAS